MPDTENFESDISKISEKESEELAQEKTDAVANTYKRGDLLKMHTYNDAIRRTVGSYILYPGDLGNKENKNEQTSVYDEILPGVGAFAVRPGNKNAGQKAVKEFISAILEFKAKESSRQYRKEYFENMVIHSPSEEKATSIPVSQKSEYQMIGFIRNEYLDFLKANGFIPVSLEDFISGKEFCFYFYFYAIKNGKVYTLHKETNKAKYLRLTTTDIRNCKAEHGFAFNHLEPWEAEIESIELVSKEILAKKLSLLYEKDFAPANGFHADYYYLAKAKITRYFESGVSDVSAEENDDISVYSPKIIERIL